MSGCTWCCSRRPPPQRNSRRKGAVKLTRQAVDIMLYAHLLFHDCPWDRTKVVQPMSSSNAWRQRAARCVLCGAALHEALAAQRQRQFFRRDGRAVASLRRCDSRPARAAAATAGGPAGRQPAAERGNSGGLRRKTFDTARAARQRCEALASEHGNTAGGSFGETAGPCGSLGLPRTLSAQASRPGARPAALDPPPPRADGCVPPSPPHAHPLPP